MKLLLSKSALLAVALVTAGPPVMAADATNGAATTRRAPKLSDLFPDEVVAQGKAVKVMRSVLDDEVINIRASALARGEQLPPGRTLEARVLSNIIGRQLLSQRATAADKATGAENAAKKLDAIQQNSGGEEALARQLRTVGMTMEQLKGKLIEEETAEAVLQREVKFEVSDADAKKFYDENPTRFEQPEIVRPAQIFFSTREKDGAEISEEKKKLQRKLAEDILKRVRAGEDFAKLAKDFSEDPMSRDRGGDTGAFRRGLPQVPAEFEARAFALEPNQISEVFTTALGYHIIKLLEKKPAKKIELAEIEARLKADLKRDGMIKLIPDYMEKVVKEAGVEILDKDLNKLIEDQRAAEKEALKKAAKAAEDAKAAPKK
jgi:parvulin-like peptidyl-prolyl isomerase